MVWRRGAAGAEGPGEEAGHPAGPGPGRLPEGDGHARPALQHHHPPCHAPARPRGQPSLKHGMVSKRRWFIATEHASTRKRTSAGGYLLDSDATPSRSPSCACSAWRSAFSLHSMKLEWSWVPLFVRREFKRLAWQRLSCPYMHLRLVAPFATHAACPSCAAPWPVMC